MIFTHCARFMGVTHIFVSPLTWGTGGAGLRDETAVTEFTSVMPVANTIRFITERFAFDPSSGECIEGFSATSAVRGDPHISRWHKRSFEVRIQFSSPCVPISFMSQRIILYILLS